MTKQQRQDVPEDKGKDLSPDPNRTFSTSNVARMLGVAVGSVANWIDKGQLRAGKTPGGHRRVTARHLLEFLRVQKLPIPEELESASSTILIVDDEAAVGDWLMAELKPEFPRHRIMQARDGFEAGELIASEAPAVVILDLKMPGLNGFEVCRRLKSRQSTRHIHIIAMTAYYSPDAEQQILSSGASILLRKPFEIDALVSEIRKAME